MLEVEELKFYGESEIELALLLDVQVFKNWKIALNLVR